MCEIVRVPGALGGQKSMLDPLELGNSSHALLFSILTSYIFGSIGTKISQVTNNGRFPLITVRD